MLPMKGYLSESNALPFCLHTCPASENNSHEWLPSDSPTEGNLSTGLILFMGPCLPRPEQNEITRSVQAPINDYLKSIP